LGEVGKIDGSGEIGMMVKIELMGAVRYDID
jgi:hypothetical protein